MNAHIEIHLARITAAKPFSCRLVHSGLLAAAIFISAAPNTLLAQQDAPPAADTAPETSARDQQAFAQSDRAITTEIGITSLRERLATECGLHAAAADDWIRNHVHTIVGNAATNQPSNDSTTPSTKFGLAVEPKSLVVTATRQQVNRIKESFARIDKTGIAQVVMRLSVYQGPADAMQNLKIRWAHVETSTSIATADQDQATDSRIAQAAFSQSKNAGGVTLAGMMMNKIHPKTMEDALASQLNKVLAHNHDPKQSRWIQASSIVELGTPVLYTMMAPEEIESVVKQAGASQDINALSSTLVAVYNGNPAQINNVIERPFVTAVTPRRIVTDGESKLLFEPRTKVYPEGFRFVVRPTLVDGAQIRLTCTAEQFNIQNVRTMDIPVAGETQRKIRVQMPTAGKNTVQAQLDIPKNFALAVSTESLDKDGKPLTTLFVCQCGSRELREPSASVAE
ncbi:MAG: hypothetical protein Aurels2KO_44010 [Aureliella sp.]